MDELTMPFLGRRAQRAGSTRSRRCARAGARLAAGSDWPVSSPEPAVGHPRRGQPAGCPRGRARSREPFLPRAGLDVDDRADRVHRGLGVREPPRRHRADRGRLRGRPRGARPRHPRWAGRRDRRRPASTRPMSTGSASSAASAPHLSGAAVRARSRQRRAAGPQDCVEGDAVVGGALDRLGELDRQTCIGGDAATIVGHVEQVGVLRAADSLVEVATVVADDDECPLGRTAGLRRGASRRARPAQMWT